ncbi:hypothetical protein [Maioricimonas rarisocia]|uniref:hypothetical protein n=1 Tax=Maioricimonas rarisocia TaxID=2528026 RepID=UPI0011A98E6F|nr:hypothetical protein [Maioricimonas rarisocia]
MAELVFCDLAAVLFAAVARGLAERVAEARVDFEAAAVVGFDRLEDDFVRVVVFFAVAVVGLFFFPVVVLLAVVLLAVVLLAVVLPVVDLARVVFVDLAAVDFREAVVVFDDLAVVGRAELPVRALDVDLAVEDFAVDDFPLLAVVVRLAVVAEAVRGLEALDFVPLAGFAAVDFWEVVRDRLVLPVDLRVEVLVVLAIPWTP